MADHISGFKKEIQKAMSTSRDAFFTWFDKADDADAAFVQGAWDFSNHIAPYLMTRVDKPHAKTVLEIGYGGGRLLAAAARHFKKAVGVDVHDCQHFVMEELYKRGIKNIGLLTTDGKTIPLSTQSVDAVYSFIVLQHVEKLSVFRAYVNEVYRVLKPGGVAVLYFGRYCWLSVNKRSKFLYFADKLLEQLVLWKGFKELEAPVNCINLLVSLPYAKKMFSQAGFKVCQTLVSKRTIKGRRVYGLQNGLVVRKRI